MICICVVMFMNGWYCVVVVLIFIVVISCLNFLGLLSLLIGMNVGVFDISFMCVMSLFMSFNVDVFVLVS